MPRTEKILIIDFKELPKNIQKDIKECYCVSNLTERFLQPFIFCGPDNWREDPRTYAYTLTDKALSIINKNKFLVGYDKFLLEKWLIKEYKARRLDLCVKTILIDMNGV